MKWKKKLKIYKFNHLSDLAHVAKVFDGTHQFIDYFSLFIK